MKLARKKREESSATMAPTLWAIAGFSLVFALAASASDPSWWNSRGAVHAPVVATNSGVVTTNYAPNPYAVVTQGQLKQFTARAVDELNADLPSGAGSTLSNMVYGWAQDYATNGYATNTANPTRPYKPSDLQAENVGQLKYIASLVYTQLYNAGYTGLMPSWIEVNTNTDNVAANLGQLKQVFDFDLSAAPNAPSGLVAVAGSNPGEIDLSWTLPGVNNANSVTIQYSTDGGQTWTTLATLIDPTTTTYAAMGLDPTQQYEFNLRYNNSNASGGNGSSTPITTSQPVTPPQPPAPPPQYAVINLGTNLVYPQKITDTGYVVGSLYVWHNGGTPLQLQPANSSDAIHVTDIDKNGRVVGTEEVPNTNSAINCSFPDVFNPSPIGNLAVWSTGSATASLTPPTPLPILADYSSGPPPSSIYWEFMWEGFSGESNWPVLGTTWLVSPGAIWSPQSTAAIAPFDFTWPIETVDDGFKNATELGTAALNPIAANEEMVVTTTGTASFALAVNDSDECLEENDSNFYPEDSIIEDMPWEQQVATFSLRGQTVPFMPLGWEGTLSNVNSLGQRYLLGSDSVLDPPPFNVDPDSSVPDTYYCWDGTNQMTLPEPPGSGSPPAIEPAGVNAMTTTITTGTNGATQTVPATQVVGDQYDATTFVDYGYIWNMVPSTNSVPTFNPPVKLDTLVSGYGTTNDPWSGIDAASINDSGAIVGTAIKTSDGSSHGVMLCPAAVVSDPNNTYQVDNTNPILTYVRFGLWDNAFDSSTPANVLNGNAESANFVGSDSRRFYIRVYDPSANHSATTADTVTVDWYTQTSSGADDDHPATDTITLTETGPNTGLFVSKALMLVTDEVDNAQVTNTGLTGGGNAAEGAADHRLRRAALGDTMCYAYTPAATGSSKQTFSLPIFGPTGSPDAVKNMTVQIVNLYGGTTFTLPQSTSFISALEASVKARWAVAGVNVNFTYNAPADNVSILSSTGINLNAVQDGSGSATGNEGTIATIVKSHYSGADSHTIFLILIQQFSEDGTPDDYTQAGGEAFTDGLVAQIPVDAPSLHCSFIASQGVLATSSTTCVPAHELGHQLGCQTAADTVNNNHYSGAQVNENLMKASAGDPTPGSVSGAIRLWDDPGHQYLSHSYQIDYMRGSPLLQ